DRHRNLVREDVVVLIEARIRSFRRSSEGRPGEEAQDNVVMRISAEKIHDLAGVRARFGRVLKLSMNGAAEARKLGQVLEPYRNGGLPVAVRYTNGAAEAEFELGEAWKVRPEDGLIADLGKWLEPGNVKVVYQ